MRGVVVLLILVAGGGSQAMAFGCTMGVGGPAPSHPGATAEHAEHHGAAAPTDPVTETPHHPDSTCPLLLPCVSGLLPTTPRVLVATAPHASIAAAPAPAPAADLDRPPLDPPPPRLPV